MVNNVRLGEIHSHAAYNLKITDLQAACGLAQLQRLPEFIAARRRNFAFLRLDYAAERLETFFGVNF